MPLRHVYVYLSLSLSTYIYIYIYIYNIVYVRSTAADLETNNPKHTGYSAPHWSVSCQVALIVHEPTEHVIDLVWKAMAAVIVWGVCITMLESDSCVPCGRLLLHMPSAITSA